jgi:phosphotriesterase-related protein
MNRRLFLKGVSASAAALVASSCSVTRIQGSDLQVMTVTGAIAASEMGLTLCHEHIMASFQPYSEWIRSPAPYDRTEVTAVMLPYLQRIQALGCQTFIDATAAYLGRDPLVLQDLAQRTGLHILTTTGAYAADEHKHVPIYVAEGTPSSVADQWVGEWHEGLDATGIRPGFIKIGFNGRPLSKVEETLIRAAAITHRSTGLTIGAHTGPAVAALAQLKILDELKIDPSAWIWIHAQNEPDSSQHLNAARRGAWIEFDGIRSEEIDAYVTRVRTMRDAGFLHRVLLSQDSGWYHIGEPRGGGIRPYDAILTQFVPALGKAGFTQQEIDTLFIRNPAQAFGIRLRLA